ncbi:hypothetical protein E2C01_064104 [Portunus trituberculatus]|uniref:Uncharacterized protein n=1 Tax=Portunus trituberculatus TaxID=210409 RepID=A0A5B7HFE0_PORTR|nr:hypothetical protein [Portunus trituberculatus]
MRQRINLNLKIQQDVLPHRTIEGIKGARWSEAYKARVRSAAGPSSPPSALDPRGPATSPPLPPVGRSIDHPDVTPTGPVSGSLQLPPPHIMSEEGVHACMHQLSNALGLSVPTGIGEVEHQVDLWCPPSAYRYRPPGRGGPVSQKKKAV